MAGKQLFEFGTFRLDTLDRLIWNGEERVDLPPKVFDTLVALVRSGGRLVTKEELIRTVWPDVVVEEGSLNQAVYQLRKALHDGEEGARLIETVPRQGYRLLAAVREREAGEPGLPAQNEQREPPGAVVLNTGTARRRSRWAWAALLAVAVLSTALFSVMWLRGRTDASTLRSIAVLPLQNLSTDPNQEFFAEGMTDELITRLAQVRELKVVSKTSVMQYKGTRKKLPQIGQELGVDAVVEGSVLRSGNRIRITAQLIRAAADRHLWARSYEFDMGDLLSVQARVAEAITREISLNLTAGERARLEKASTANTAAYDAYLHGRHAWSRRNEKDLRAAVASFQQAIDLDPNFASAYAGLADCYTLLALWARHNAVFPDARVAAQKALDLDDGLAEAHTSLAAVKVYLDWDWAGAEREFKRALELNPNDPQAHHWYGNMLLLPLGRHAEAIREMRRALELDPFSLILTADLGCAYYFARRYDTAFEQYRKVQAIDPDFVPLHYYLLQYYQTMNRYDEWFHESLEYARAEGHADWAETLERLSPKRDWRSLLAPWTTPDAPPLPGSLAGVYALLGDRSRALTKLEEYVRLRDPVCIYLKTAPVWDSLRSDRGFQQLERRVGLEPEVSDVAGGNASASPRSRR